MEEQAITDEETLNVQFSDRHWTKASQDVQFALLLADWCRVITTSDHSADNGAVSVVEMINRFENTHAPTDQQAEVIETLRKGLAITPGYGAK
jgi:hypothetical protein